MKRVNETLNKIVNERVQTLSTVFRPANKYFKTLTHISKYHWMNYSTFIIVSFIRLFQRTEAHRNNRDDRSESHDSVNIVRTNW